MSKVGKGVISLVVQGPDLEKPVFREVMDELDVETFVDVKLKIAAGDTNTFDFEDLEMAPKAVFIFTDQLIKLDFGFVPPPSTMIIRSVFGASYKDDAPPEYVHIINDQVLVPTNVRVIAFGDKLP